jgi:hypothetical protein
VYDLLRNRFRVTCPNAERELDRPLSAFRAIERLPGANHPAVYHVTYRCSICGGDHPTLISEHDLDCAPVAPRDEVPFVNVLTGSVQDAADDVAELAELQLRRGNWPWTFYCAWEHEMRPGYPSHLPRLEPTDDGRELGVLVRCAVCHGHSINLVSQRHLDEPFFHDRVVRYVDRPLRSDATTFDRFTAELWSSAFDAERNRFAA